MPWTMPSRRDIDGALLERVGKAATFKTLGRRLRGNAAAIPTEQPAAFLSIPDDEYDPDGRGMPAVRRKRYTLWVYVRGGGATDDTAAGELADVLDGLDVALAPDGALGGDEPDVCTLGGLVERCEIDGVIETVENSTGPSQAFARIPITVLLP